MVTCNSIRKKKSFENKFILKYGNLNFSLHDNTWPWRHTEYRWLIYIYSNLGCNGGGRPISRSGRFSLGEIPQIPINEKVDQIQGCPDAVTKIIFNMCIGIRNTVVQSQCRFFKINLKCIKSNCAGNLLIHEEYPVATDDS